MSIAAWDYGKTKKLQPVDTDIIKLSTSPIFIFSDGAQNISNTSAPLEIVQKVSDQEIVIHYNLDKRAFIDLDIIDTSGKRIKSLIDQESVLPGKYKLKVTKISIPSGVYFVRLLIADKIISERIVIQ